MTKELPTTQKCCLLRLPSLFPLLYLALFHRPTTERRPRGLRLISSLPKVTFVKIETLKKLSPILKKLSPFLKRLTHFLRKLTSFLKRLPMIVISPPIVLGHFPLVCLVLGDFPPSKFLPLHSTPYTPHQKNRTKMRFFLHIRKFYCTFAP